MRLFSAKRIELVGPSHLGPALRGPGASPDERGHPPIARPRWRVSLFQHRAFGGSVRTSPLEFPLAISSAVAWPTAVSRRLHVASDRDWLRQRVGLPTTSRERRPSASELFLRVPTHFPGCQPNRKGRLSSEMPTAVAQK